MSLLTIDESLCKKDGLCAADCPMAIIRIKDENSFPELVPDGDQLCLRCGHCVAVCPHGALNHAEVPLEDSLPITKEAAVTHAQAVQLLRSRRSVRRFKDKPVGQETLQQLIELARYAPTGSNAQLIEWIVINDRQKIHNIAAKVIDWMRAVLAKDPQPANMPYMPLFVAAWDMEFDAILHGAPGLIIATAPKEDANGMVDITLALSYLELAATTLGLGTCWAGLLRGALYSQAALREVVGIPDNHPHYYGLMIGYPAVKYYRMPARKTPKIIFK